MKTTRTPLLKKMSTGMQKLFLATVFLIPVTNLPAAAQTVKKATQGTGAHKDKIWWLDFTGIGELAAGDFTTQTFSLYDGLITLVVKIDNITFTGALQNGLPLNNQRLVGYKSGDFDSDGLVQVYNIGVTNGGTNPGDRGNNTLINALSMKYNGGAADGNLESVANFRVQAYAYITATGSPLDAGLVFANAETDDVPSGTYEEYSQGTTNGSAWQLLEKVLQDPAGYQKVIVSNGGQTARTMCGANNNISIPGNVVVMYTNKAASSVSDPLSVNMEFKGIGKSAIAIGLFIAGVDKGDAMGYTMANNMALLGVSGGNFPADGNYYISSTGTYGATALGDGTLLPAVAEIDFIKNPVLGTTIDYDDYTTITVPQAKQDDNDGIADEDGVSSFPVIIQGTTAIGSYPVDVYVNNSGIVPANIYAWIDWDNNGLFDGGEQQTVSVPASFSGTLTLTWTGVTIANPGSTGVYARFRVSSDVAANAPGAYAANGEVEDYFIPFDVPTPVKLMSFNVNKARNTALLTWATASEQNNKGFEIEKSTDGISWDKIGFVNSLSENGNSNIKLEYTFTDNSPANSQNFYRLKQTDCDGRYEYSPTRTLNFGKASNISIYPNPAKDNVIVSGLSGGEVIELYDVSGRVSIRPRQKMLL